MLLFRKLIVSIILVGLLLLFHRLYLFLVPQNQSSIDKTPNVTANHSQTTQVTLVTCFFPGLDCQTLLQPVEKNGQVLGYGVLLPQDSAILSPVWGEAAGGQLNIIADNQFKGFPMTVIYPDKDARPARIEFIFAQPQKFIAKTLIKGEQIAELAANPAVIGQFGRFDLIIRAFNAQNKPIDPRNYLDES